MIERVSLESESRRVGASKIRGVKESRKSNPFSPALRFLGSPILWFPGSPTPRRPDSKKRPHATLLLAACLCALILAGCSMAPRVQQPEAVQTMPDRFDQAAADDARAQPVWWHGFNDAVLDQLVDTALVRNLDLRVAVARVKEVQSQYRIARAPLLPSVQATLDRNQQSTPANTGLGSQLGGDGGGPPGGFTFPDRFEFTTYSASLGFSYELDFWGRVRGLKKAALREFFASQADLQTAQIGVIAETISTYFEIAELERTLALTRQDVALLLSLIHI